MVFISLEIYKIELFTSSYLNSLRNIANRRKKAYYILLLDNRLHFHRGGLRLCGCFKIKKLDGSSRHMGRFFPYLGGKTAMISELLEHIPPHTRYVEAFGGSAELLLRKPRSKQEVYNDVNGYLVNLFIQVRDNLQQLQERLYWLPFSRELYEQWSRDFRNNVAPSDPVEQAARFYYVLCCQFAGRMYGGWSIGRTSWSLRRVDKLKQIHERLQGVAVECNDYRKVLETWDDPETFIFLDPPYLGTTGYRQGFTQRDHLELRKSLEGLQGHWLLTINDHPHIRKLYRGFNLRETGTPLNAEKLGKNQPRGQLRQLIITN